MVYDLAVILESTVEREECEDHFEEAKHQILSIWSLLLR